MGLIPDEVIAEIRARSDIVAVIGQHMQLKRAGRNWKGLCPFHGEKTPSFNVSPDKGFFYCFGCQKKGDVFTFVMEYQGKSFHETAEALAAQCGVTIPETQASPEAMRARSERTQLLEINKLATQFFRDTLAGPAGAPGREYLAKRGTNDAMRDRFQLGYAPADWHALADFLKAKRVDMELAVKLGLVARQPQRGGFYDRFRDRLVCPVVMPGGEVAGFSARLVAQPPPGQDAGSTGAKYINSPESPVYKKSRLLFGLQQAREAMGMKKRAVLVEGNFDVISMHQAGFGETIAPLGTALTAEQVELLRRMAAEVVLFYDGDRAGRVATKAALELCLAADVPVKVAWRSRGDDAALDGQDPDTLLKSGRVDVEEMIKNARDGLEAYTYALIDAAKGAVNARAQILDHVAKLAGKVAEPLKRDVIAGTLAMALDLDQGVVRNAISRSSGGGGSFRSGPGRETGTAPGTGQSPSSAPVPQGPPPKDEVDLLALLADHPSLLATADANGVFSLLTDARLRDMYSAALRGGSLLDLAPSQLPASSTKTFLEGRYASASDPQRQLLSMIDGLRTAQHSRRAMELRKLLADAQRRGDLHQVRLLMTQLDEHHKTGR
ncbi:MAG: DNA primase [Kofleriaceae bacterium]|nr:MAG: DNA primase [Kofleriaceae bacterium]MBZ0238467.1 DNA primase [Kofleriaceae bacterium]